MYSDVSPFRYTIRKRENAGDGDEIALNLRQPGRYFPFLLWINNRQDLAIKLFVHCFDFSPFTGVMRIYDTETKLTTTHGDEWRS